MESHLTPSHVVINLFGFKNRQIMVAFNYSYYITSFYLGKNLKEDKSAQYYERSWSTSFLQVTETRNGSPETTFLEDTFLSRNFS